MASSSELILQSLQNPAVSKSIHFRMQLRAMIDNDDNNDNIVVIPPGMAIPCAFDTLPILCSIVGRSIPNFAEILWGAVTATADVSLPSSISYEEFPRLFAFLAALKPLLPATCYRVSVEPWAIDAAANGLRDQRDAVLRTNPTGYCKWAGEGFLPAAWGNMRHAVLVEEVAAEVVALAAVDPSGLVAIVMTPSVMTDVAAAIGRDTTARISLARSVDRIHVACEEVAVWSTCMESASSPDLKLLLQKEFQAMLVGFAPRTEGDKKLIAGMIAHGLRSVERRVPELWTLAVVWGLSSNVWGLHHARLSAAMLDGTADVAREAVLAAAMTKGKTLLTMVADVAHTMTEGSWLRVVVLTASAWPTMDTQQLSVPKSLAEARERVTEHYKSLHTNKYRKLMWVPRLDRVVIEGTFVSGRYEFSVNGPTALGMLLFNASHAVSSADFGKYLRGSAAGTIRRLVGLGVVAEGGGMVTLNEDFVGGGGGECVALGGRDGTLDGLKVVESAVIAAMTRERGGPKALPLTEQELVEVVKRAGGDASLLPTSLQRLIRKGTVRQMNS